MFKKLSFLVVAMLLGMAVNAQEWVSFSKNTPAAPEFFFEQYILLFKFSLPLPQITIKYGLISTKYSYIVIKSVRFILVFDCLGTFRIRQKISKLNAHGGVKLLILAYGILRPRKQIKLWFHAILLLVAKLQKKTTT